MDINKVHSELKSLNKDLPAVAFTKDIWEKQIEAFSGEYFGNMSAEMLESPLEGIYADFEALSPNPKVNYNDINDIKVENYEIEFTLKTKNNANSYISKHRIVFRYIGFSISTKDGIAFLQRENEKYLSFPPTLNNQEERELNFNSLRNDYGYTDEQIEYFINMQESSAGFLVANGLIERLNTPFKIVDFSIMFPKIIFSGDFVIKKVNIEGDDLITFMPESFERKEPTQCEIDDQNDRTFGTGTYENGEFRVGGGAYPSRTVGKYPRPSNSKNSEIFLFLPNTASEKLLSPSNLGESNKSRNVLAKSKDSWEIPPFLISHKAQISTEDHASISWDQLNPYLNLELGFYLDFYLKVWLKVFRLKTKLGSVDTSEQYEIKYKGQLIEFYNGDLGFVGELWDPSNFTIRNFHLDTILPDSIDRVASKILKYVLEPIMRFFITKLMITVTWPLISKYIFFGLGGAIGDVGPGSENGRSPNVLPKIELSNYFADNDSMTMGVTRKLDDLG
ncbi:hypothetical protein [Sediminitomix flava]|uniref:Uncharacterized protein n=1 Tax=Sediminitomix flava TaxID=379075 RepID=A0A315YXS4_SEDFL|nr:hypothetical protein [Sediminitomix flava]PWJ33506.1 hypothetical protein BC781_1138 [Sediminitomix flava]